MNVVSVGQMSDKYINQRFRTYTQLTYFYSSALPCLRQIRKVQFGATQKYAGRNYLPEKLSSTDN